MTRLKIDNKSAPTNFSFYLECMAAFAAAALIATTTLSFFAKTSTMTGFVASSTMVAGPAGALASMITLAAFVAIACLLATNVNNPSSRSYYSNNWSLGWGLGGIFDPRLSRADASNTHYNPRSSSGPTVHHNPRSSSSGPIVHHNPRSSSGPIVHHNTHGSGGFRPF